MKKLNQIQTKTDNHTKNLFNPFLPELERVVYTTNSQQEIWTDCIFGGNEANKAYNLSTSILLKGKLEIDILDQALHTLALRHENLRASISPDGRFMCVYKESNLKISHINFSSSKTSENKNSVDNYIKEETNTLFDLVNGPLFRASTIKINDLESVITLTIHHIIGDGLSINIILDELSILYSAYIENNEPNLPEPEQFSDYVEKVNTFTDSENYQKSLGFWTDIYKNSVPTAELPLDFTRPSLRTYASNRLDFHLDQSVINNLKNIGLNTSSSLVTTLLAAFEIFIYKITCQNDIIVGSPYSGNIQYDMKQLVGDCVNLLPLRSKIDPSINFLDYLQERNSQLLEAYEYQQITFGHLLRNLAIARDPSRIPLVPVTLTIDLSRDIESEISFAGLKHEIKTNPRDYGTFEIELHINKTQKGAIFQWTYNTALFKQETISHFMFVYEKIINNIITNTDSPIIELLETGFPKQKKSLPPIIEPKNNEKNISSALTFLYKKMQSFTASLKTRGKMLSLLILLGLVFDLILFKDWYQHFKVERSVYSVESF